MTTPNGSQQNVNWSVALENVGGDEELLVVLIDTFFEETPMLMGKLRESLDASKQAQEECPFRLLELYAESIRTALKALGETDEGIVEKLKEMGNRHSLDEEDAKFAQLHALLPQATDPGSAHAAIMNRLRELLDACRSRQQKETEDGRQDECPFKLVERHAHTIKGSLRIFCAAGQDTALKLELMGKEHELQDEDADYAKLQAQLPEIVAEFERRKARSNG